MKYDGMIAVIQAAKEGKTIQARGASGCWMDTAIPVFDFARFDYRVKPSEPKAYFRAIFSNRRGHGVCISSMLFRNEAEAVRWCGVVAQYIKLDMDNPIYLTDEEAK